MGNTNPRSRTRTLDLHPPAAARRQRLALVPAAIAMAASLAGCGGGGDSGGAAAGGSLAFSVAWEQRGGAAAGFETPIPPSVSAIRIILDPEGAPACCIAVIRGSSAFEDRHLLLADVPVGEATVEVFGFPTDFAPNDGVTATCATRTGDGVPCSSDDTLPSFGSDETPVDVLQGQQNRVDVDVYSLPFLLDLDPADGGEAEDSPTPVSFTVVDANHSINPGINITAVLDDFPELGVFGFHIESIEPCRDNDAELPDCSEGGELEVQGLIIEARSSENIPGEDTATLTIVARNTASPPREMESVTSFTTHHISTTTSTSTTSTSSTSSTTTTLAERETFCLNFSLSNEVDLIGLSYTVGYAATGGDFLGSGEQVACISAIGGENTLASFNDNDEVSLSAAVISADTFSGPTLVAECTFEQVPPLVLGNFSIQVTEATAPDLTSTVATVIVEEGECTD